MVDQPECGTNNGYVVDTIPFRQTRKPPISDEIRDLSLISGKSASQLARHFGVSKSTIIKARQAAGVKFESTVGRSTNPQNYRCKTPPYGYRVFDGKLVLNNRELKLCRTIVALYARRGLTTTGVSQELTKRGFRNRAGKTAWDHKIVKIIYKRWKDKI